MGWYREDERKPDLATFQKLGKTHPQSVYSKELKWPIAFQSFYVFLHSWHYSSQVAQWLRVRLPSRRHRFNPWVGTIPWRRKWQPTPVFLPGKSHGQRSLTDHSPWGHKGIWHNIVTKQQQHIYLFVIVFSFDSNTNNFCILMLLKSWINLKVNVYFYCRW